MAYDAAAKNLMLDQLAGAAVRLALHTDDPGAGSANELAGSGYARQLVSWAAASGGVAALSAPASFSVPAVTIRWVSCWNEAGTIRYWKLQLGTPRVFGTPGTYNIDGEMDLNA